MSLVEQELHPSGAPEFTPGFEWGSCYSIFSFICIICRSMFVLLYVFFSHCVVCCLRFTDSDYPIGIFKLFLPFNAGKWITFIQSSTKITCVFPIICSKFYCCEFSIYYKHDALILFIRFNYLQIMRKLYSNSLSFVYCSC